MTYTVGFGTEDAKIKLAQSVQARSAWSMVQEVQSLFAAKLAETHGPNTAGNLFQPSYWFRDDGRHGGGKRLIGDENVFNRASINVSHVQYDDLPERPLASATALSTIIHPAHPALPSLHLHVSWTELKAGAGYWRIMIDLNPSIPSATDKERFDQQLRSLAGELFDEGTNQGEKYFYIPALGRRRGVSHFYLENFRQDGFNRDLEFVTTFARGGIDAYIDILSSKIPGLEPADSHSLKVQREYHTLYFFQVLTLDRGTTAGLLVHDQNDVGILGSLPRFVDRTLLVSWQARCKGLTKDLLSRLVATLPTEEKILVDDPLKILLAQELRSFYHEHPEALKLLARGHTLPTTTQNHRGL